MENKPNDYSHINGWGIDADPRNEPTYPIKHYTGDDHQRIRWDRPPQQPETVEVLHSNERPYVTAVFGTSVPPMGLSGAIRRYAFKYSESSYGHWLPLLLADRVNVVEGIIDDLKHGHVPNIFAEKGWKAEWKHNRGGLIQKVAVGALAATVVIAWLSRDTKKLARR
ncbi:hypothetical protein ACO2Q8_14835 [Larkinella sp. VNQ87]|uniref:hypothetical protein n=1 Tax=Larkinella sp. VNQ87 TaxID=3400921 RepID=UPI003C07B173